MFIESLKYTYGEWVYYNHTRHVGEDIHFHCMPYTNKSNNFSWFQVSDSYLITELYRINMYNNVRVYC